jgi:DNA primase
LEASLDTTEEIKSKLDIVSHISEYVNLKKAGQNFSGLCPFHAEKTPSFTVSPAKQTFHCFGCNTGGDIFAFEMKINNTSFPESLELLAKKAGVEIKNNGGNPYIKRLYEVNEAALRFFQQELLKSPAALEYLSNRGISMDFIERFKVGYAGFSAVKHLLSEGFTETEIVDAGLGRKSGTLKDVFWGRVMFPVVVRGRVRGFGGRAIKEGQPKYINTSSTPIFNKSEILYCFDPIAVKDKGYAIVVEGFIDATMCHFHGLTNTVSPLGTAFTPGHLEFLQRYCNKVVLVFDGDSAGAFAAERTAKMMFDRYVDCSVVVLPDGEDPDTFLRKGGDLLDLIDNKAIPASVFLARFKGARKMVFNEIMRRSPFQVAEFLAYGGTLEETEMFSQLSARDFILPFLKKSPIVFRNRAVEVKKHGDSLVLLNNGRFMFHQPIVSDYKKESVDMANLILTVKRKAKRFKKE